MIMVGGICMNGEMMVYIENYIGAYACCIGIFISGKLFLKKNLKEFNILNYVVLLIFAAFLIINSYVFENIMKIFGTLAILYGIYKLIFKKDFIESFMYSIITYMMFALGETTFVLIVSLVDKILDTEYMTNFVKTPLANVGIAIFTCLYTLLTRKYISNYLNKINKNNIVYIFLVGIVTIFIMIASIFNLYHNDWIINESFILNTIIIVGCICLIFVLIKQYLKNKEITDKYELLEEYMKTSAELIEKYSSTIHKYKNNLITIKGYMKSNMKEANKYVDSLLDNFKNKKYSWFSKINHIKIDTIRYLIYYKLSKAEESNLKMTVNVSKEVKEVENNIFDSHELGNLLEILGEYFDNAIYASNESFEKELNLDLYLENNNLFFIIANTYKNDIDLSLITKYGYTTKGNGHGLGLYDVDKTIKNMKFLSSKYEIVENYFVVSLEIDISKVKKK